MRTVPDWAIQTSWWLSGIFATGAVWYFLSTRNYAYAVTAVVAATFFALIAIALHRKKDALAAQPPPLAPQSVGQPVSFVTDKTVTTEWWDASNLRKEYENRGLTVFRWSNADRVPEREQQGYEVVYLDDATTNTRVRIVNKGGQVLIAKRSA